MKRSRVLIPITALVVMSCAAALGDTFTVTNTNDSGAASLRQAILDANSHIGADTITFNIPGTGVHTITPASDLPAIADAVVIDGYTQPGASMNTLANGDNAVLKIELNGTNVLSTGSFIAPSREPTNTKVLAGSVK